jgi:hypothetical protein
VLSAFVSADELLLDEDEEAGELSEVTVALLPLRLSVM